MKKVLSAIITLSVICCSLSFTASAQTVNSKELISENSATSYVQEYYPDGSYLEVSVVKDSTKAVNTTRALASTGGYTTSGHKTGTYKSSTGEVLFSLTVYGDFYFEKNNYCSCTKSTYSTSINQSSWHVKSASSYASSNSSIGNATFIRKLLFVVVDTQNMSLSISCDTYGNLY